MRRSSKKFTTVVAVSLPLVLALSACAAGGGGGGDSAGGGDGDETLSVWAWDPLFNIAALEEAEKIYQEDHPDFELDIIETPGTTCSPS